MIPDTVTIAQARLAARNLLHPASETAQLDADIILSKALSLNRSMLDLMLDVRMDAAQKVSFENLLSRRIAGEPVAYLTEFKEFWSLKFHVTAQTLVPRPETELVVERILAHCGKEDPLLIADLGTGSGAIALALAFELPTARILATDISDEALQVATKNQKLLGLDNVQFHQGNWASALPRVKLDLIAANPPYIRDSHPCLADKFMMHEPQLALTGGKDGLDSIRQIFSSSIRYLKPGGWLVIEHGFDQEESVKKLMKLHGFEDIQTFKDLAGLPRVSEGKFQRTETR